ncbi:nuclear transport factor 2 family protein [Streptomyces sp. NRRL F-5123]|uniref:nuclear transport factor 2 family protein n=1 Tax=Streptomyces sp. NRRL F-5123 TaxID=1463856 RepID=UPI0004E195FA|nr:nuclear transport factor 2 family protein [Streptomyces sp. NRRL F-5123]
MADTAARLEADLRDAERDLQAAVLAGDADALDLLLDDRVRYTGPDGGVLTKADDLAAHRTRTLVVEAFDQEELHVTVAGTTGVTYVLAALRGTAAGEPFAARLRYTRTWAHTSVGWRVLAAHAGAVLGG